MAETLTSAADAADDKQTVTMNVSGSNATFTVTVEGSEKDSHNG